MQALLHTSSHFFVTNTPLAKIHQEKLRFVFFFSQRSALVVSWSCLSMAWQESWSTGINGSMTRSADSLWNIQSSLKETMTLLLQKHKKFHVDWYVIATNVLEIFQCIQELSYLDLSSNCRLYGFQRFQHLCFTAANITHQGFLLFGWLICPITMTSICHTDLLTELYDLSLTEMNLEKDAGFESQGKLHRKARKIQRIWCFKKLYVNPLRDF